MNKIFRNRLLRYGLFVPCIAITANDYFLGVVPVYGDTYRRGIPDEEQSHVSATKELKHVEEKDLSSKTSQLQHDKSHLSGNISWVLVDRFRGAGMRSGTHGEKGEFVVLNDPMHASRYIIRRIRGIGEGWIQDQDEGGNSFHMYLRKGFCYVDSAFLSEEESIANANKPNINSPGNEAEHNNDSTSLSKSIMQDSSRRYDSLEFGPISRGLLQGPPLFVLYPWSRFGPCKWTYTTPQTPAQNLVETTQTAPNKLTPTSEQSTNSSAAGTGASTPAQDANSSPSK